MERKKSPVGGGFAVMVCTVAGAIGGLRLGQGSAGLLIGLVTGLAIAALVWAIDSRRR